MQGLMEVISHLALHLRFIYESDLLLTELVPVLQHALLEIDANLFKTANIAVFASCELICQLLHCLLTG